MTTPKAILKVRDTTPAKDSPPVVELWLEEDHGYVKVKCQRKGFPDMTLANFIVGHGVMPIGCAIVPESGLDGVFPASHTGAIRVQP